MISKTEALEVILEVEKNYPVLRPYSKESLIITEDQLRVLLELARDGLPQTCSQAKSNSDVVSR